MITVALLAALFVASGLACLSWGVLMSLSWPRPCEVCEDITAAAEELTDYERWPS